MARRRRRKRSRRLRRRILRAAFLALLAGLCVAALATALPVAFLRVFPPPTTAFMLRSRLANPASGQPCARVEQRWVAWEEISPHVPVAVVVAEDQRFLQHVGFDFRSIGEAVQERVEEGRVRGASTISQQLAKNLFLWPEQSLLRKGLEAWFTVGIEFAWPKRRILEVYLNVAQFGPCTFGVEAASQRFFDTHAAALTPEQAALLAAVLPNPYRLRAHNPGPYARQRSEEILELMERLGESGYLRGL
jgi:monofunctional biosynthetic peptidoglycan transglycosylase